MKIRKSMTTLIRTAQYCHIELGCEMEYDSETDDITSKETRRVVDLASTTLDKRLGRYWKSMHSEIEQHYAKDIASMKYGQDKKSR